jgi:hypothetical protein
MKLIVLLLLATLSVGTAHAGCSEELLARRNGVEYYIGDHTCSAPELRLEISDGERKPQTFAFLSQCMWTKSGFRCKGTGVTPLAGAAYERIRVTNTPDACGNGFTEQYRCVSGCKGALVPKVFRIEPYEC